MEKEDREHVEVRTTSVLTPTLKTITDSQRRVCAHTGNLKTYRSGIAWHLEAVEVPMRALFSELPGDNESLSLGDYDTET